MPFKLRLKRSRQYNVVSKSLFVICVELLDGSSIECTLSAESSGQECLDSVCQRLGLQQPEFFGLRYTWRHGGPGPAPLRWVELERPLKRQLDKHARGPTLLLRIMYYVGGVNRLHDEMTRYHYFLQLKMDVIEGRIRCDPKEAVLLASYSMQAEFGNHDPERHTAEYLKDFNIFPKLLIEKGHLETMTEAVIRQHAALVGLAQGTAEEFYILAAQQLHGYGQETFMAREENGMQVMIAVSLMGIFAVFENYSKFFRWKDISNVINQKRHFGIECQEPSDNVQFVFPDPELAKYVWRMCIHQHTFYMQNEQASAETRSHGGFEQSPATLFHSAEDGHLGESHEELDDRDLATWGTPVNAVQRAQSTSCLDLSKTSEMDRLRALLPSYRPAPDYETAVQLKYHGANQAVAAAAVAAVAMGGRHHQGFLYSSQPEIHQSHLHETTCHFPDVATVATHTRAHIHVPTPPTYNTPQLDAAEALRLLSLYPITPSHALPHVLPHAVPHGFPPNLPPALSQALPHTLSNAAMQPPPPPYPVLRASSSSTPDLASQATGQVETVPLGVGVGSIGARALGTTAFGNISGVLPQLRGSLQVSGSSPDLVSTRGAVPLPLPLLLPLAQPHTHTQVIHNAAAHRTYTNLAAASASASASASVSSDSGPPEPIYENVPLPWANAQQPVQLMVSSESNLPAPAPARAPSPAPVLNSASSPAPKQGLSATVPIISAGVSSVSNPASFSDHAAVSVPVSTLTSSRCSSSPPRTSSFSLVSEYLQPHCHIQPQLMGTTNLPMALPRTPKTSAASIVNNMSVTAEHESTAISSDITEAVGKGKTKRKWVLLGGKGKGKSNTLGKEKSKPSNNTTSQTADAESQQNRWSTRLPRLPLPPTISKETMCRLLEKKLADSQLFFEFEKIPKKKADAHFSTALHPDNEKRNRYTDVLPYEENRVRLTPSRENKFGYINASHITATVGSHQRFYIAAQGPLPQTVLSFWQMVWEADVYLVVMLCGLHEQGTVPYCPAPGDHSLELGEFQVWRQFSQETGHCVTTKLRLYHSGSRRMRGVWHLQYMEWGEQGCPLSVGHFLGFLEELSSVRQHTVSEIPLGHNRNPPVLVHCSAGVGRTGVAILSDLLLFTLDHNQELDIPRVTALLRHQRMLMVQTVAQYRFVYTLLIYYLKHSRLI